MKKHKVIHKEDIDFDRFWSKVELRSTDECWPWLAYKLKKGHGRFRVKGRTCMAHRVAYAIEHGTCDDSLIRHLCGNAACCNPAHLAPGTHLDNAHDRREHGTAGNGVLTEENAIDIIELLQAGFAQDMIAEAFECSRRLISHIATGECWAWLRPDVDRAGLRRQRSPTRITDEMRAQVRELRSRGLSQRVIADRVGVGQRTVGRVLRAESSCALRVQ